MHSNQLRIMNFNKPNHSASLLENIAESFLFTNDGNVNEESLYVLQNILAAHGARFYYDRNGSLVIEQSQEGIQLENNQEKSPLEIPDLVVFPALVSNSIRTYTLNESNIGKNRKVFNILNTNNETVFVTRAQLLSWGVTLYIYDMDRRPLLLIDQKNLKLNSTYNFCDPKTRKVFCQGKKKIFSLRSHYTIRDTKRELLYTVDGDFFCNNYHSMHYFPPQSFESRQFLTLFPLFLNSSKRQRRGSIQCQGTRFT